MLADAELSIPQGKLLSWWMIATRVCMCETQKHCPCRWQRLDEEVSSQHPGLTSAGGGPGVPAGGAATSTDYRTKSAAYLECVHRTQTITGVSSMLYHTFGRSTQHAIRIAQAI